MAWNFGNNFKPNDSQNLNEKCRFLKKRDFIFGQKCAIRKAYFEFAKMTTGGARDQKEFEYSFKMNNFSQKLVFKLNRPQKI